MTAKVSFGEEAGKYTRWLAPPVPLDADQAVRPQLGVSPFQRALYLVIGCL